MKSATDFKYPKGIQTIEDWEKYLKNYHLEEWARLENHEKAMMINYRRQLLAGKPVAHHMTNAVADIMDKYPYFHIGRMP